MVYLVLMALAISGQLAAHYFPWKRLMHRELPRPLAYIIGVAIMITPYAVWLGMTGAYSNLVGLLVVVFSSGLAVLLAYLLDAWLSTRAQAEIEKAEADCIKKDLV